MNRDEVIDKMITLLAENGVKVGEAEVLLIAVNDQIRTMPVPKPEETIYEKVETVCVKWVPRRIPRPSSEEELKYPCSPVSGSTPPNSDGHKTEQ